MIPDTKITRGLIYASAVIQTAVAPFAFFYYIYYIASETKLFTLHPSVDTFIHYWLGCELMFYVYFQITRSRMQRILPSVAPSAKERSDLYAVCLANIDQAETWLPDWFMLAHDASLHPQFEDIGRDNVAEWLSWAFFGLALEDVLQDEPLTEELNYMIDHFEEEFHVQFNQGYNEELVAYRINLDPVQAYHRPLAFYTLIAFCTALFGFFCQFVWKLKKYGPETTSTIWNLMDPQQSPPYTSNLQQTAPEKLSYWHRDGNRNKKPIVFIHGIGAGLMCYISFVSKLLTVDAPIFFIELPWVSMHCIEEVPTMQETIRDIQNMLDRHGFEDAVFVAHSLGTAITSWAVKYMSKHVASVIFLDPICFMLHYKDVCSNFVYRTPKTAAQGLVKYFASTELYISYYISRHFHWFQTALYVAPNNVPHHTHAYTSSIVMPKNTKVFLSEKDNIIDSMRVDTYLNHHGVDSTIMKGLDHASFLFYPSWQNEILEAIRQFSEAKA